MKTILWIPDGQNDPGRPTRHYKWIANFIKEWEPDEIVVAGDWNDVGHFSSHDAGTRLLWGKSHQKSCDHSRKALELLMEPWARSKKYKPKLHALSGNHDGPETDRDTRMERMMRKYPAFAHSLECPMQCFRDNGWKVYGYKEIMYIQDIAFSHLFNLHENGKAQFRPGTGAKSASTQVGAMGGSAVAGHRQGYEFQDRIVRGKLQNGLIAGSCYLHEEPYMGKQGGNAHWNGIVLLNVTKRGSFEPHRYSLDRLKKEFS